ncbi:MULTISPECIES: glycosyltransferase family 2 protein [unclassified Leeuwenhoekiella]|uniref:glycosyltransferase family 2 protein n=1 Tax=unclassified Leeuwenhoekiella TaxID=2615029 RepID=UPI0025BE3AF7|nr:MULTISPECIES: glycosyltransferase family 2 protein [unclassified Leeuwenhoekiella]
MPNRKKPLVSIIIPTYNRSHLINETLESVLAQTYKNWECIVVDDGSIDDTEEVVKNYIEKDSRFKFYNRPSNRPKGANTCRNYGFELSKGAYIQWLDSDDLISEKKLEAQVSLLEESVNCCVAICKWDYFTSVSCLEDLKEEKRSVYSSFFKIEDFLEQLSRSGGFLPPHVYLIPRKVVSDAGNWLEYLKINQDGEFFSRIFIRINGVLFSENAKGYYRLAGDSNVSNLSDPVKLTQAVESWKLIEANLTLRFGSATNLVSISKKYLGRRIAAIDKSFYDENKSFFEKQKSNLMLKGLLNKLIRKIKP